MKLIDWHQRIVAEVPYVETVRPPGQAGAINEPLDSQAAHSLTRHQWSVLHLWLGYGRYEIEARARSGDDDVNAVTCSVIPRDVRRTGIEYGAVVYEADAGTDETMRQLVFAILRNEAEHNV